MRITHLPAHDYRRMRWKNDRGWTREILRVPDQDDYGWRVSIAEIDADCDFSAFPGCDRVLVLLRGNGMRLDFADGRSVVLDPPHGRIAFRGEDASRCSLADGPTHDFNLIWRRDRVQAQLLHRPLVGPMVFLPEAGVDWLVYVVSGRAQVKDHPQIAPLDTGDSVHLAASLGGGRVILDGGGELLLARLALPADASTELRLVGNSAIS